jgi:hypothetical protein
VDALREEQRRGRVAEVVEPDRREPGQLERFLERRGLVAGIQRAAGRVAEDEPLVLPGFGGGPPGERLAVAVQPQGRDRAPAQQDRPARPRGLWVG